ncbi:hypothetical protein ACWDG9_16775 [Streptomyces sp. NPDC001073]
MTGTDSDLSPAAYSGSRLVRHAVVLDATAFTAARLHGVVRMLDATAARIAPRLDAAAGAIVRRIYPDAAAQTLPSPLAAERGRTHAPGIAGTVPARPA